MSPDELRYSSAFLDHLMSPRHMAGAAGPGFDPEGEGVVQGSAPGASLRVWITVDPDGRIERIAWQATSMPQVVASTSAMAELVLDPGDGAGGMTLEQALRLTPEAVAARLGGLPARKIHETVIGPRALREAVGDRFRRMGLDGAACASALEDEERLCHCLGVTARELKAVVQAGRSFREAQDELGVSTGCGSCEPDARALHAWFREERLRQVTAPRAGSAEDG